MSEQLSLFGDENTLFDSGVQQLLDMDFDGCLKTLDRYEKLFPWGRDVSSITEAASFLGQRLKDLNWQGIDPHEAERIYHIWLEFERAFGCPWEKDSVEAKLQVRFLVGLVDALDPSAGSTEPMLPGGTPVGLLYILAGRPDEAISALQSLIAAQTENATAYGYLGDAYFLRGDAKSARLCYREAFLLAPDRIDLERLLDSQLKDMLQNLQEDESLDEDPFYWFPVRAQLDGFFETRRLRDLDDLKHWLDRYLDLEKVHSRQPQKDLLPKLFYHAMVLSDNADMMRFIKKVEILDVRKKMKEWHPYLFARHMRVLEARTQRVRV
jgi:tetratricopeptide (TPR) repeat protein